MKKPIILFFVLIGLIAFTTSCTSTSFKSAPPEQYRADLLTIFSGAKTAVNKNVVFAIGSFEDKTGKFMDGDQLRYSKAVTQAGREMLTHFLSAGGFRVVNRDPYDIKLVEQEYKMAHTYLLDRSGNIKEQAGLIKRGGPTKGLTGATYVISGAITTYQVSAYSGGFGIEVDTVGVQAKFSQAVVGIHLRVTRMDDSEIVATTMETATVLGQKFGINGFKLISHGAEITVVSAEAGLASQFPADFALNEALVQGLARILTTPGTDFYKSPTGFDFLEKPKPAGSKPVAATKTKSAPATSEAWVPIPGRPQLR